VGPAGARYLLIGGFALILHGGERTTKDIDLLVDPAPDNVARLKDLLLEDAPDLFRRNGDRGIDSRPLSQ